MIDFIKQTTTWKQVVVCFIERFYLIIYKVIIFNPVNKIKSTNKGVTNLKILKITFNSRTLDIVFSLDNVSLNLDQPHTQPTKMLIIKPPTGSRIFEETKSKRSKKVMPNSFTDARLLFERAENQSDWSEIRSFVATIQKTHANGSYTTNTRQPFTWEAVSGTTGYEIETCVDAVYSAELHIYPVGVKTTYTLAPNKAFTNHTYYWRMRAQTAGCPEHWTPIFTFTKIH